jgi:DNA-binding response OmpR family regulator
VLLPDVDGFEVCGRLRAGANDVPVIFLTARDATSDAVNGLTIGGGRDGAGPPLIHTRRGVGYSLHLP